MKFIVCHVPRQKKGIVMLRSDSPSHSGARMLKQEARKADTNVLNRNKEAHYELEHFLFWGFNSGLSLNKDLL